MLAAQQGKAKRMGTSDDACSLHDSMHFVQAMDKRSEGDDGWAQQSLLYSGPRFVADPQNGVSNLSSTRLAFFGVLQATTLEQHDWGCCFAAVYVIICHAGMTCG